MIAVVIYGEFRTFDINLEENLKELFGEIADPSIIHFYILTERTPGFAEEKEAICQIIKNFGSSIRYFETMDSCSHYDSELEQKIVDDYKRIPDDRARDSFTPRLYYRRCLAYQIMNTLSLGKPYDRIVLARPFDMVYKRCRSLSSVYETTNSSVLYYGVDSLFIGNKKEMDQLLTFRPISNILSACGEPGFLDFFRRNDRCLAQIMPVCLETIYQALLFTHFRNNSTNLRYDYTRFNMAEVWNMSLEDPTSRDRIVEFITPFIETDTLFILHCPRRK
uniref:Uncharacterized protein n=1 Tax=viral metagenome TaxID=1070528 RepID=A0A6C0I2X2_9ZZZZ